MSLFSLESETDTQTDWQTDRQCQNYYTRHVTEVGCKHTMYVPMKFAHKLIHGGPVHPCCEPVVHRFISMHAGQMVLSAWINIDPSYPRQRPGKIFFDLVTLTFDLWPWFSRSAQTSSRSTSDLNLVTLGPLALPLDHWKHFLLEHFSVRAHTGWGTEKNKKQTRWNSVLCTGLIQ